MTAYAPATAARTESKEPSMNQIPENNINESCPALRLPFEITCYIFEIARGQTRFDSSAQDGPWKAIQQRPEITISHVCRSWRSISLAHPALWSHFLHIHPNLPMPLDWLSAYLDRSKNKPLDILLDLSLVPKEQGRSDDIYADTILDMLIPHASRWRRLSLYVDEDDWEYIGRPPLEGLSVLVLEVLEIAYSGHVRNYFKEENSVFISSAPNLVSVRMECSRFKALAPLSTITTLYLYGSRNFTSLEPWDAFLSVIANPTLVNLTIEDCSFQEPVASMLPKSQRILAANLKNLRLCKSFGVTAHIWSFVIAPQLELFAVFSMSLTSHSLSMVSGVTFASLKTLVLVDCYVRNNFVVDLSRVTTGVTHLIVGLSSHVPLLNCISRIASMSDPTALWPNLEAVTCTANIKNVYGTASLSDYAKVVTWQAAMFNKSCVLRVKAEVADYWVHQSSSNKELWEPLLETGVGEVVGNDDGPYSSLIPWPHHSSGHFRVWESELSLEI